MFVIGDVESVNLSTGDRYRRITGDGESRLIRTYYWNKPIPNRNFDWEAIDDNYDGAPDSSTRNQIGYGATEQEAIESLLECFS